MTNDYIVELTDADLESDEAFDKHNDFWHMATNAMLQGEPFNVADWTWDAVKKEWLKTGSVIGRQRLKIVKN